MTFVLVCFLLNLESFQLIINHEIVAYLVFVISLNAQNHTDLSPLFFDEWLVAVLIPITCYPNQ